MNTVSGVARAREPDQGRSASPAAGAETGLNLSPGSPPHTSSEGAGGKCRGEHPVRHTRARGSGRDNHKEPVAHSRAARADNKTTYGD
ncbi:hypothetical protein GCM10009657_35810 [Oryzihumus leptocrescens]